jgi:hypothetical protein
MRLLKLKGYREGIEYTVIDIDRIVAIDEKADHLTIFLDCSGGVLTHISEKLSDLLKGIDYITEGDHT